MSNFSDFDLVDVVNDISSFDDVTDYQSKIKMFLLKTTKNKTDIYKQEAEDKTKKIIFEAIKTSIQESRFKNRETMGYDPVISKHNVHEVVTISDYSNISDMLNKFDDESEWLTNTKGLNESKFQYWMVSIQNGDKNYKVIGNFSNVLELQKKYLFGFISMGNFDDSTIKFADENNVFGFNKKIELVIVDNEFIVINAAESKFENIFKMDKLFSEKAIKVLNENESIQQVFSADTRTKLIDKSKNGKRLATRLIKIVSDKETFSKTIENINKLEEIIQNPEHKFFKQVKDVVLQKGQLSVKDGQEIQLINAISDAWVEPVISGVQRQDEARM